MRHYSIRTEAGNLGWIKHFIVFQGKRHSEKMGLGEVAELLTYLAVVGNVVAGTRSRADRAD